MRMPLVVLFLILLPWAVQAQPTGVTEIQLSSPQHAGSDVNTSNQSVVYSPDGRYVCFIGDTETEGAEELWCADTDSGAPAVRVSGILPSSTSVRRPNFNAAGDRVFYIAPGSDASKDELFMVVPDGSQPPIRLNAPLIPAGADVGNYRYIPETEQLTYTGASQVVGQNQLHIVSVDTPGVVTVLNGPLVSGGDVTIYEVLPASGRVVYLADQQVDGREELYSVLFNGAGAVKINGPLANGGSIFSFDVSPDGSRVAYIADENILGVNELFVSPVTGGGSTRVSGTAVTGGDAWSFRFSPDSQWLLFLGDLAINGWRHLYSSPADGSQATPNVLATQVEEAPDPPVIELAPQLPVTSDGTRVIFRSVQGNASTSRLLSAPIAGDSPPQILSNALTQIGRFEYVPDVERVVLRGGSSVDNLYSISVDGSSFIALTNFLSSDNDVFGFATPTGVVYFADPVVDDRVSLFFVDYLGQQTQELSSTSEFFRGLVSNIVFSNDRRSAYFVERLNSPISIFYSFQLKVVHLDDLATAQLAFIGNSALITGEANVLRFLPSPAKPNQVFYIADKLVDEQADAFLATFADVIFSDRFEP